MTKNEVETTKEEEVSNDTNSGGKEVTVPPRKDALNKKIIAGTAYSLPMRAARSSGAMGIRNTKHR